MSYPLYPNSGPGAPKCEEGTPGTRHVEDAPSSARPYPTYGDVPGTDKAPPEVPASTRTSLHAAGQAGKHVNPYPVHGLQYALDSAMGASKDQSHFQSGDIRHANDMSGGSKVSEKPGKVAAVSAALEARTQSRKAGAESQDQKSAFKRANKGARAGSAARDAQLRHAGSQADINSAASQR